MRRRERFLTALAALAGAGLALLAAGRPWVTQQVGGVPGVVRVSASGDQAAPGVAALAIVAGAGAGALLIAGLRASRLVGVLLALAGAGILASVASVVSDPRAAAAPAVPAATGRTGPLPDPAAVSPWVWVALVASLIVVTAGLVATARATAWAVPGRRFEQPAAGVAARERGDERPQPAADDPIAAWDALSRGDDPTA